MESQVLLAVNAMLYALYAGVVFVSARIFGWSKSAVWFAASNLCWSIAMICAWRAETHPSAVLPVISPILMVSGFALMHRTFAELLDRSLMLWRLQMVMVLVVTVGVLYFAWRPSIYPVSLMLVIAVLGVQTSLTASALFSFSGEGVKPAGWFTGISLALYALIHLMRVAVTLRYGSDSYVSAAASMRIAWLYGTMMSAGATAFGFLFVASAKLRLELLWRAQIDELTGLLNRWAFNRIAMRETMRSMRMRGHMALISMDLDGMKRVNDHLGHGGGDALLQAVSASLQETVRDRDSIARMGGDEFCILLPDTDLPEALVVAERLRAQLEKLTIRYRGETVDVRASFGVSSSARCGWNWQRMMDDSDSALYEAKRGGVDKVVAAKYSTPVGDPAEQLVLPTVLSDRRKRGLKV